MSEYFFRRYRNGERMAEDVRISQAATLEEACLSASRIAAQYKDGTALVYEPDSELWAHKQMAQDRSLIDTLRAELAAMERRARTFEVANVKILAERDALRAQLDEARDALEPFADMLMSYDASKRGWMLSECRPKIGALRRARAVLDKIKGGGDE